MCGCRGQPQCIKDRHERGPLGLDSRIGTVERVTAIAEEQSLSAFRAQARDERRDACIAASGPIDGATTVPEQLLMEIEIGMAVIHLHDGEGVCPHTIPFRLSYEQRLRAACLIFERRSVFACVAVSVVSRGPTYRTRMKMMTTITAIAMAIPIQVNGTAAIVLVSRGVTVRVGSVAWLSFAPLIGS